MGTVVVRIKYEMVVEEPFLRVGTVIANTIMLLVH